MEKLILKYESAMKSISTLGQSLVDLEKFEKIELVAGLSRESVGKTLRDSIIQRFEYSIDTLWKYLKEYLLEKKGVSQVHPKPIFRECFLAELLSEDETNLAIKMVENRNETSHAYNEKVAEKIYENIPKYFDLMKNILEKIKP